MNANAPHRNRVLRAMRLGKKKIAERRQQQLFDAADRGEETPEGPLDASLLLSGLEEAAMAESGIDAQEQREKRSLAVKLMAAKEKHEEAKKARKKKWRSRAGLS